MRGTANRITFFSRCLEGRSEVPKGTRQCADRYPNRWLQILSWLRVSANGDWGAKDLRIAEDFRGFSSRASSALPFGYIRSPNTGRIRVPTPFPINAAANHNQPCTLEEAMPLKYAPILQPYAIRAP